MTPEPVPADYAADLLSGFGMLDAPTWGGPDDPDPVRRAARIQEQVARSVKAHLRATKTTQGALAETVGLPRSKVNRLLSGQDWARLYELERLMGAVGETMASVMWAVSGADRQPQAVRNIIAAYLHEQLAQVEAGNVRTEQERPSTPAPRH